MINAFPKIFALGTTYISDIFKDEVEVSEKLDGSSLAFGKQSEELFIRSKGAQLFFDNPQKMFAEAVDYVATIEHLIPDNMTFYGEYLQKPKHNVIKYDTIPKNHIALFAIQKPNLEFLPYEDLIKYAELFNIDKAPLLFRGNISDIEDIKKFLELDSYLGGAKIEGVVVKNFHRPFLLGGQPIPIMAGKLVSPAFKEVHQKEWKQNSSKSKLQEFFESFRTEARWLKAIQHKKELGELPNPGPKDIGGLIKSIHADIVAEEEGNIKEFLWNQFRKDILRISTRNFPEFYKEKLLDESLSN